MIAIQRRKSQSISVRPSKTYLKHQTTINDLAFTHQDSIAEKYNELISKLLTSEVQNITAFEITRQLRKISPSMINISLELAKEENEIVFIAESQKAQNIIVLDEDGDLMVSHSPLLGNGWREFIDNNKIDLESVVYKFLSV